MYCIDVVRKQTQSVRKICARDKITQLLLLKGFFSRQDKDHRLKT